MFHLLSKIVVLFYMSFGKAAYQHWYTYHILKNHDLTSIAVPYNKMIRNCDTCRVYVVIIL